MTIRIFFFSDDDLFSRIHVANYAYKILPWIQEF